MNQCLGTDAIDLGPEWFELMAENLPVAVSYVDSSELYRYCNKTYEAFFKRDRKNVLGRSVEDVAGDQDYPRLKDTIDKVLSGETVSFEIDFVTANGETRTASSTYNPHFDENGNVAGYFALTQDITRQKRDADALRHNEQRFMDFAAAAADRVWETDKNHVYTYMSEPTDGLPIPVEEIIGRRPWETISKSGDDKTNAEIKEIFEKKEAFRQVRFTVVPWEGFTNHIVMSGIPKFDDNGEFIGFRGISISESEIVEAREKAAHIERKFLEAMEHMGGGYTLWSPDGKLEGWNEAYRALDWEDDHILVKGTSFLDFMTAVAEVRLGDRSPEDRAAWVAERIAAFDAREVGEDLYRTKTGRWFKIVRRPLEDGSVVQFVTDITEQKEREREIRASEERFRDFTAAAADRFWETDENHLHTYMSPPTEGLPMPSETIIGKTAWDVETREVDPETKARIAALFDSQEPFHGEHFHWKSVRGHEIHVVMSGVPVLDRQGNFKGYRGVTINETDAVQARERAARVERKFMEAMEHMGAGYTLWSADRHLEGWNEAFARTREDFNEVLVQGMDYPSYLRFIGRSENPEFDDAELDSWVEGRLHDLDEKTSVEHVAQTPDGNWFKVWKQKLADGSVVIFQADITEQQKREEELRVSEAMFRQTFEAIGNGMAVLSVEGEYMRVNQALADMLGYTKEELVGKSLFDVTHPDDREASASQRSAENVRSGRDLLALEKRMVRKDGKVIWVLVTGTAVLDASGNPLFRVGHIQDITKRREDEEALRQSEERFRLIVEALDWISDGIEIIEPNGRLLYCNTRNAEFYPPYAEIAVPGTPLEDLVRAVADSGLIANALEDRESWIAARMESFKKGSAAEPREGRLTNGRWLLVRNFHTDNDSLITVRTDVTERKTTEQSLSQSQQRLQAITETLHEGVLVINEQGRIAFSNPSAGEMLGVDREQSLLGTPVDDLFCLVEGSEPVMFADGPLRQVIDDGVAVSNEDAVFATSADQILLVDFACAPLREKKKSHSCVLSFRNIKERKEAQKELFQSMKLASVGELAAGIAHEINTPVQYIGDNLRFIQDSVADMQGIIEAYKKVEEAAEKAGVLEDPIKALHDTLKDADLDYLMEELPSATKQSLGGVETISRIVLAMKEFAHPGQREKAMANINKSVENTLTVSRNEWKHHAELETDLDENIASVPCLVGEINQVLLNLIVNATHAIQDRHGDEMGLIKISTHQDGEFVEIRVSDNGSGIPEHAQDHVFDQFFTTKDVGKGTGQGLAVSYDVIVNKHGGTITFETEEREGTTFIIRLPVNTNEEKPEAA